MHELWKVFICVFSRFTFFVRIGIHFLPLLFKHLTTLVDLAKSNKKIIIWQRVEVTTSQFLEYNLIFSIFSQNIAVSEQTSTIILLDDWIILEIESFWLYSMIQYAYTYQSYFKIYLQLDNFPHREVIAHYRRKF